jgi:hypothetical protein
MNKKMKCEELFISMTLLELKCIFIVNFHFSLFYFIFYIFFVFARFFIFFIIHISFIRFLQSDFLNVKSMMSFLLILLRLKIVKDLIK